MYSYRRWAVQREQVAGHAPHAMRSDLTRRAEHGRSTFKEPVRVVDEGDGGRVLVVISGSVGTALLLALAALAAPVDSGLRSGGPRAAVAARRQVLSRPIEQKAVGWIVR